MLLTLSLLAALNAPVAADSVSGAWRVKGEVAGNPLNTLCTLVVSGTAISGNCAGEQGPPQAITGEVKDGKITFQHGGDYQGQELTVIYAGTLEASALKGTITVKPFDAGGEFSATREPQPAAKK
jgi:hypothetical protein